MIDYIAKGITVIRTGDGCVCARLKSDNLAKVWAANMNKKLKKLPKLIKAHNERRDESFDRTSFEAGS